MVRECETLIYLARAYFHQDFNLLALTPIGVVETFIVHEPPETSSLLHGELVSLLAEDISELAAQELWMIEGGASFDPARSGGSYVAWLRQIKGLLDERAEA
jgi:hypothetical protein